MKGYPERGFIQLQELLNKNEEESDEEDIEMEEAFDEAEDADSESSDDQ
jgi:hypothetical protein